MLETVDHCVQLVICNCNIYNKWNSRLHHRPIQYSIGGTSGHSRHKQFTTVDFPEIVRSVWGGGCLLSQMSQTPSELPLAIGGIV